MVRCWDGNRHRINSGEQFLIIPKTGARALPGNLFGLLDISICDANQADTFQRSVFLCVKPAEITYPDNADFYIFHFF
jgi:hypothetical protein